MEKSKEIEPIDARKVVAKSSGLAAGVFVARPAYTLVENVVTSLLPAPVGVPAKIGMTILKLGCAGALTDICSQSASQAANCAFNGVNALAKTFEKHDKKD